MADARPTANDGPATDTRTDGDAATKADLDAATRAEVTAAAEVAAADTVFDAEVDDYPEDDGRGLGLGLSLSFQSRLTIGLIAAAVLPLAGFGLVVLLIGSASADATLGRVLLFAAVTAALVGVLLAYLLAADLTGPLRAIAAAVDRVSAGDLSTPIAVPGEDELARLADSHNRLAAVLERRNRELGRILAAIERTSPRDGAEFLAGRAASDARAAFEMIDCSILLVDPRGIALEERIPGEPLPVRAILHAGDEELGVLVGHLSATRAWERADQDLLELFASEIAVAIRNAQLFARVEAQNSQLLELDAAKDDFLRGVSHNLQTPLTSIRAYAHQLQVDLGDQPDRRLGIIAEQTDRLSRMVRQLLTVTRLESGALPPRSAVAVNDVPLEVNDAAKGWLAIADVDQLDQVLWALLDNAVKYGNRTPLRVDLVVEEAARRLRLTIADSGPGVAEADRGRLFGRFVRGSATGADEGSGLGLYVSRELCRAMGGDLVLEPSVPGGGASLSVFLPGEPPDEG